MSTILGKHNIEILKLWYWCHDLKKEKQSLVVDFQFKDEHPGLAKMNMTKDLDPTPIDNEIQDMKRTEYLVKYCSRG